MHDDEPDLSSYQSVPLTQESKDTLLNFMKSQLVSQGELPQNADVHLKAFVLDKDCQQSNLDQRYIVQVSARWFTYKPMERNTPELRVVIPEEHGADIYSYVFKSCLDAAEVNLSK